MSLQKNHNTWIIIAIDVFLQGKYRRAVKKCRDDVIEKSQKYYHDLL